MAAPLGQNLVPDPGFDDPAQWTLTDDPPNGIAEIVGGQLHLVSGAGAEDAWAIPIPPMNAVIGQEYLLEAQAQILSGTYKLTLGGPVNVFSKDGYVWVQYVATTTDQFVVARNAPNTEVFFDWVSVRKVNFDMSHLTMEFRDFDGDKKQFSIEMGDVTDGITYDAVSAEATALATAIAAVCAGNVSRQQFVATDTEPDDTDATDFLAQAHVRWIIEYKDAVTGDGPYQIAIPTPDLGDNTLVLVGSNHYDPANAEWITLIAAMEGGEVKNPRTGNNITIQDIFLEE